MNNISIKKQDFIRFILFNIFGCGAITLFVIDANPSMACDKILQNGWK